jgi:thymidylate synthase (FAD)
LTDVQFTSTLDVELLKTDFSDEWPIIAARTSTKGAGAGSEAGAGLINALVRDSHGVPFEQMSMTVRIRVPVFVQRQLVKHRSGVSVSEESGRSRELDPLFYVPDVSRMVAQVGKPMNYDMIPGSIEQKLLVDENIRIISAQAYAAYNQMLDAGITRELARAVLPLNWMTTAVVTFNARSLMHFLSLRTSKPGAVLVSHPQYEIEVLADRLEDVLREYAPLTHAAFVKHGRQAP